MAMTVNECKEQVLRLLDEVGVSDYAQRINHLIDKAQRVIATTCGFIKKRAVLTAEEGELIALPADCFAIEKVKEGTYEEEPLENGGKGIILSGGAGTYTLIYKAYPDPIGDSDDGKELQIAPEYYAALCFYVAALTQDNEYDKRAFQLFKNEYNEAIALVERTKNMNGKARVVTYG